MRIKNKWGIFMLFFLFSNVFIFNLVYSYKQQNINEPFKFIFGCKDKKELVLKSGENPNNASKHDHIHIFRYEDITPFPPPAVQSLEDILRKYISAMHKTVSNVDKMSYSPPLIYILSEYLERLVTLFKLTKLDNQSIDIDGTLIEEHKILSFSPKRLDERREYYEQLQTIHSVKFEQKVINLFRKDEKQEINVFDFIKMVNHYHVHKLCAYVLRYLRGRDIFGSDCNLCEYFEL